MENIIILILTAAVMIGGAISSANKKKKEAARNAGLPDNRSDKKLTHKSFGEIIGELEEEGGVPEWQPDSDAEPDNYEAEVVSLEERAMAEARLSAMTYRPAARRSAVSATEASVSEQRIELETEPVEDLLEGGFDLKRAIVESEILKSKYEQY